MSTRITINGQEYDSPEQMPPDVRQLYEQAMARAKAGGPGVKVDTVRFNPTFTFRIGAPPGSDAPSPPRTPGAPRPIEPSGIEASIRSFVITVLTLVALSVAWWWWRTSSH